MDTDLLKRAREDITAFEELVTMYEKNLYNTAYRMMGNREDAQDMCQEAFIKIYKNLDKCTDIKVFRAWAITICTNVCIDEIRRRKRRNEVPQDDSVLQLAGDEPGPEDALMRHEAHSMIEHSISQLSPEHRAVIVLRDIQGLSYEQLSEVTGKSMGTVKSRLARARAALGELLKREQNFDLSRYISKKKEEEAGHGDM